MILKIVILISFIINIINLISLLLKIIIFLTTCCPEKTVSFNTLPNRFHHNHHSAQHQISPDPQSRHYHCSRPTAKLFVDVDRISAHTRNAGHRWWLTHVVRSVSCHQDHHHLNPSLATVPGDCVTDGSRCDCRDVCCLPDVFIPSWWSWKWCLSRW